MKSFAIVIPSYKNANWYKKNLLSALSQKYSNFRILYADDCSPDNTGGLVEDFLKKHDKNNKVKLFRNTKRIGALHNIYNMVHSCEDDEIVVTLDGDDWFPNSNVLLKLNQVYSQNDVWLTYGQYRRYPDNSLGCNAQVPMKVIANSSFRSARWTTSHLRTFYTWLFKKIKKEDLQHNGDFFPTAWDLPMMFPMLEMAGPRQKFISDIMYIYNWDNPINDSKVNLKLQEQLEAVSRAMPKYPLLKGR